MGLNSNDTGEGVNGPIPIGSISTSKGNITASTSPSTSAALNHELGVALFAKKGLDNLVNVQHTLHPNGTYSKRYPGQR